MVWGVASPASGPPGRSVAPEWGEIFDDAVENAIAEASKTVSNIKSLWVENMSVTVEDAEIQE